MKCGRWTTRLALVLSLALVGLPASHLGVARAQDSGDSSLQTGGDGSGDEVDRWWGAAGAVLCGAEIRLATTAPVIGMNPYVMGAGIGGCLLALLDIATT